MNLDTIKNPKTFAERRASANMLEDVAGTQVRTAIAALRSAEELLRHSTQFSKDASDNHAHDYQVACASIQTRLTDIAQRLESHAIAHTPGQSPVDNAVRRLRSAADEEAHNRQFRALFSAL